VGNELVKQLHAIQAAAKVADIPRTVTALKDAGRGAAALEAYPIPRCADPHGYWQQVLTLIRSAADNAQTGSGLGALLLALVPLKQIPPLEIKLGAELKQTAGVSKPFG
jgi:hypothetical protein